AGEGREEKGEALGGVGSAGLAQAGQGTVRARVRCVEVPGTSGQQDRAQGARGASQCPAPVAAAMTENSDKVPIALVGPDEVEFCSPPIYNVHYTMSINGKLQDGSMEIDAGNNLETFKMGSGAEEAIEVNDFQNGITGIRFAGGEKCYIKAQVKARVPEVGTMTKQSISSELEGKIMPVKYEENSLIWVAVDQPVKDNSFLSSKILELCGDLPIFWLKPTYPKDYAVVHGATQGLEDQITKPDPVFKRIQSPSIRTTLTTCVLAFQQEGEGMTFDPRLDHEGICCIECRRSYTHCQKICEPLGGYYPWPYNYQGCRSACRVVMPCSWWVARILGMV
ncbi:hypothetical protein E2I00_011065, partial [Balaenoptera physalus]